MENDKKILIEENMNLVYFLLSKYYPTFIADEDLVQCGMVGLCNAADTYKVDKCTFSTYAAKCILNEFRQEFRCRYKHNDDVSINTVVCNDGSTVTLEDTIVGDTDVDVSDFDEFESTLPSIDQKVCDLRKQGLNRTEIGEALGYSHQWVSQELNKIKNKWRNFNGD